MSRLTKAPSPAVLQALLDLAAGLRAAPHGRRGELVAAFGRAHGLKANAVYQNLSRWAGFEAGRKSRSDAGSSCVSKEALIKIASLKTEGVRLNGKATLPTSVGLDIMAANGLALPVGASQVNRLLRGAKMDTQSQKQARSFSTLRSLYPNHVHEIDPSLCLIYYMRGKQAMMRDDMFYKNKLENTAKIKQKVWRYVRVDHASGVIDAHYIEAAGESQAAMFEFLMHTWGKQAGRLNHGVPQLLLWDKGSANTAGAINRLLEALGVETHTHFAGHAWAKGAVEVANNIIETQFESRLRFEPVDTVAQLNAALGKWLAAYNANTLLVGDSRIRRVGCDPVVRNELWQLIKPEQLVELPKRELCEYFMAGKTATRQIDSFMRISFKHPLASRTAVYDLSPWAGELAIKDTINITPLLLGKGCEIRASLARRGANPLIMTLAPVADYDEFNRPMSGQVIGQGFSRHADNLAMQAQKQLQRAAWGTADEAAVDKKRRNQAVPFSRVDAETGEITGGLISHSHLAGVVDNQKVVALPRKAKPMLVNAQLNRALEVMQAQSFEAPPLTLIEAAKQLRLELGAGYSGAVYEWLGVAYPSGVPAAAAQDLAAQWLAYNSSDSNGLSRAAMGAA